MTPRRRRTGGGSSGGGDGSGPSTRRPDSTGGGPGGNGVDVDADGIDTMAGRLGNTGGRVDAVGTTLDGINVGPQSMGIIGSGFTGAAQTHVQSARQQVTRTRAAVQNAQDGTSATAQTYRDTDATNAQNLGGIGTSSTPPTTSPQGSTTPASSTPTPSAPGSISAALDGGGGTPSQAGPQRTPRRRRPRDRPADAAALRDNRPKIRKRTKFTVYKNSQRAANGNIICPSTGEEIPVKRNPDGSPQLFDERGRPDPNGFTVPVDNPRSGQGDANYHFGHVPDSEYHRLMQMVEDNPGRWSHQQVLDEYNQASHYQVEAPAANVGHSHESTAPGYGHYQGMQNLPQTAVQPPPANPPAGGPSAGPSQQPPRIRRR